MKRYSNPFSRTFAITFGLALGVCGRRRSYRYRLEFEKNTLLQLVVFDEHNKLAAGATEDIR